MCKSNKKESFNNLIEVMMHFSDEQVCKDYLAELRWANGIFCPHCENDDKIYTMKRNYKCAKCRKQFSVTKGSIFENSGIPLQKWFAGVWLITSHKKGISSLQLHRDLGITQKSAWFMLQRIRFAIRTKSFNRKLENTVEADETYIGGKNKNRHQDKKVPNAQGRSTKDKTAVFGLVERNGRVTAMKVKRTDKNTLQSIINKNVSLNANLMTDEWKAYKGLSKNYSHLVVKHGEGQYVNGKAHTNTIEGFWSLLKRGIIGIYHNVSAKHLNAYVDEFEYRYNTKHISCVERFNNMLSLSNSRLTYNQLIG
ncbi:MAG: IS1595 family transposase [Flavobacteriales bacterium]